MRRRVSKTISRFQVGIVLYVLLQMAAYYSDASAVKSAGNIFALLLAPLLLAVKLVESGGRLKVPFSFLLPYLVYFFSIILCVMVNGEIDPDLVKILLAPVFFILAYQVDESDFESSHRKVAFFFIFVSLPIFFGAADVLLQRRSLDSPGFLFFSNRNNAALYGMALVVMFNCFNKREIYSNVLALFVALAFGTLGIFFAVLVGLIVVYGARPRFWMHVMPIVGLLVIGFMSLDLEVVGRVATLVDVIESTSFSSLEKTSYSDLVATTGTSDLSFLFRLKHWSNIFDIIFNEPGSIAFGFGVGASERLTEVGLVPHNDYLRVLFELGAFSFLAFFAMLFFIVKSVGLNFRVVPIVSIVIYFFSENLITNYLAMAIFYFSAGVQVAQARRKMAVF